MDVEVDDTLKDHIKLCKRLIEYGRNHECIVYVASIFNELNEIINDQDDRISELEEEFKILQKENLELRLRPPELGGPEYEEAKSRFNEKE